MLDLNGTSSAFDFGLAFSTTDSDERSGTDKGRSRPADNLFVDFGNGSPATIIGRASKGVSTVMAGIGRCL